MSELALLEPPDEDAWLPPQDIPAEVAVIGSALVSAAAVHDTTDLSPADFYRPQHETIWAAIRALAERGDAVDVLTVSDELHDPAARAYLHHCAAQVATPANAGWHADIVESRATLRRVIEAGHRIVGIGQGAGDADPLTIVDDAREVLDSLSVRDDTEPVTTAQAVAEAIAALDEPPGLPTPWADLTQTIAGWKPGNVYVCGARPGVGKSVVGVNAALDIAERGQTAVILSMEMSRVELFHRMLCQYARVSMQRIQNRELTDADRARLDEAAARIARLPLVVDDRSHLSVAQARSVVRRAQRRGTVGIVVVDYLGLMRSTERHGSREQEVAAFSRGLKVTAKDLAVPVLVLAQLNRGAEQRMDKTPNLSDLRESGQIEADADVVILLHRDMSTPESQTTISFHIRKNRHGPAIQIDLGFAGHYSHITDGRWS